MDERRKDHDMDGSSIKPVSSLRSHFESIGITSTTSSSSRDQSPTSQTELGIGIISQNGGRTSLDLSRGEGAFDLRGRNKAERLQIPAKPLPTGSKREDGNSINRRQRPLSMGPASPPPKTGVEGTYTKPQLQVAQPSPMLVPSRQTKPSNFQMAAPISLTPRRSTTPRGEPPRSPFLHPSEIEDEREKDLEPLSDNQSALNKSKAVPPVVNRADKPKIAQLESQNQLGKKSLQPINVQASKTSPFSTPPSSDESPRFEVSNVLSHGVTNAFGSRRPERGNQRQISDLPLRGEARPIVPPQIPYASKPNTRALIKNDAGCSVESDLDSNGNRPMLPPRRDLNSSRSVTSSRTQSRSPVKAPHSPPLVKGNDYLPSATSAFPPPPRRHPRNGNLSQTHVEFAERPRISGHTTPNVNSDEDETLVDGGDDEDLGSVDLKLGENDYPDISQINRRPPVFKSKIQHLDARHDTKIFAISGEHVCTTGHVTRVWNLKTGEALLTIPHEQEDGKVTAVAFKAARNLGNEGTQIWLGYSTGDIQELDIPAQRIIVGRPNAHKGRDVLRIFRHGKRMWTLDETRVYVWPPIETSGTSDLRSQPISFGIANGHTFSMAVGQQLWVATGRDIWIYNPESSSNDESFQVLSRPLGQNGAGVITSGTVIPSQKSHVLFGHMDGKVTLYDRNNYTCLGIFTLSSHKINSMVGVGENVWTAYNTGIISVFSTKSSPWKILKEWRAHGDHPVIKLAVDSSSVWKLDRLQVASLGLENVLYLWDGFLEDDRVENDVQDHEVKFCQYSEVEALVLTWNAGASKPQDMRRDERDINFFRDLLSQYRMPEILVFGFQELVDLEAKRTAARSIFSSSKKKDVSEPDHVGHQYREWRDHLERVVRESTTSGESYFLLHNANLVGLFSCIFIKSKERSRIRGLDASNIRRGMGGLAGNKGALITRFLFDDSSLCFVNCHLAAGQNETPHRNKDVAAILESYTLAVEPSYSSRIDHFVGGGDGRMILDHEICILNGDLNYRIGSMPRSSVIRAVKSNDLDKLLQRDQLLASRRRSPSFKLRSFVEMPIDFAPTYKYDVGKNTYDSSSKARSPAWCDRILYRGKGRVKQLDYRRHEVYTSDHRPVSGHFRLRIRSILPRERQIVWEECRKRFNEVKLRLIEEAKLDFLVNTCNVQESEARKMLAAREPAPRA